MITPPGGCLTSMARFRGPVEWKPCIGNGRRRFRRIRSPNHLRELCGMRRLPTPEILTTLYSSRLRNSFCRRVTSLRHSGHLLKRRLHLRHMHAWPHGTHTTCSHITTRNENQIPSRHGHHASHDCAFEILPFERYDRNMFRYSSRNLQSIEQNAWSEQK